MANGKAEITMIATNDLKARVSLLDLLTADGHTPRKSGVNFALSCMFHDEHSPSFIIFPDGHYRCFGCGEHGDVIDYIRKTRGVDFVQAAQILAERAGVSTTVDKAPAPAPRPARKEPERIDPAVYPRLLRMAETLALDTRRCERIAQSRGWKAETVRGLALEASLGWHEGKLAFLYEHRAKFRSKENGERVIRWDKGKGELQLWRAFLLTLRCVRRVIITEGETDAITLIDSGAEDLRTVVVSMPSASTFKADWAPRFAGKEVVLMLDNDKAGEKATADTLAALRPHARSISTLNWKEVNQ